MTMRSQGVRLPTYYCFVCKRSWVPRKEGYPRRCGKCGSPYWDVEKPAEKAQ